MKAALATNQALSKENYLKNTDCMIKHIKSVLIWKNGCCLNKKNANFTTSKKLFQTITQMAFHP